MNNLRFFNVSDVSQSSAVVRVDNRPPSLLEEHQNFYADLNRLLNRPVVRLAGHWTGNGISNADEGHLRDAIEKVWNLRSPAGDTRLNEYIRAIHVHDATPRGYMRC